jgi:hypothetical protein
MYLSKAAEEKGKQVFKGNVRREPRKENELPKRMGERKHY